MDYGRLTVEQKTWISEIQRAAEKNRNMFAYVPNFECDIDTGEVFKTREGEYGGIEIEHRVGFIPLKAIPHRARLLREREEKRIREIESRKEMEQIIEEAREWQRLHPEPIRGALY
jgi:hypothetical protein